MTLFEPPAPLAARMRPRTLEEFVGQEQLLAPGRALGDAIRRGTIGSVIFWGPPGSGKTSLAYLIARYTEREFVPFSAVMIAAIAPIVTNTAAPFGRYIDATSAIGAVLACNRPLGSTPNDTIDVKT